MEEDSVIGVARPRRSVVDLIDNTANERESSLESGGLPGFDKLSPLPGPGDAYVAASRTANKPVATLHLVLADGSVRGFSNALLEEIHLLPAEAGGGMVVVMVFAGTVATHEVKITGRRLDALYGQLAQRRIWWVREAARCGMFGEEAIPVIERIAIAKAT